MTAVKTEILETGVCTLCVDRPTARNALDLPTMGALATAIQAIASDQRVKAVVVHGGGGRFISGGDLKALHSLRGAEAGAQMAAQMRDTLDALEALPVPVVAAIDGFAIGGGAEVALAADLRIIESSAFFSFKHIEFGLLPGWGGARRLAGLVGVSRARQWLWTGVKLTAQEAADSGLACVAPKGQSALESAMAWATRVAERPAGSVRGVKALLPNTALPRATYDRLESAAFAETWASDTHWALVDAFWRKKEAKSGR